MRKRVRNLGRLAAALGLVMSMTGMTAMAEGAPVIFIGEAAEKTAQRDPERTDLQNKPGRLCLICIWI